MLQRFLVVGAVLLGTRYSCFCPFYWYIHQAKGEQFDSILISDNKLANKEEVMGT